MSDEVVVSGWFPGLDGQAASPFTVSFPTVRHAQIFDEKLHAAIIAVLPAELVEHPHETTPIIGRAIEDIRVGDVIETTVDLRDGRMIVRRMRP